MTRTPRRPALLAAAIAVLAVTGCSGQEAGAAAVVGDRKIPVSDVQEAYGDVRVLAGADSGLSQRDILNWLILEPYVTAAASQNGIGVSSADAELQFAGVKDQLPEVSDAGIRVARAAVSLNRMQNSDIPPDVVQRVVVDIGAQLRRDGVDINPRYGTRYDTKTLVIDADRPNWLVPSPTPTPEPGAGQGATPTPTP